MQPRSIKRYGWKRDLPDHRDFAYLATHFCADVPHPPSVDLKPKQALVFDQGELGSCTANSTLWHWQFVHGAPQHSPYWSRMFLYVECLVAEGAWPQDAGAELRNVMKVFAVKGVCPEADFPYDVSKFPAKPGHAALHNALQTKLVTYSRLLDRADFLNCLASGFPFVFGFTVFSSFESAATAKTGVMTVPTAKEECMGGHAVCCIGYDMNFVPPGAPAGTEGSLYYLVQNSWGEDWGDPKNPGCFWMPADVMENGSLASDHWTLRNT